MLLSADTNALPSAVQPVAQQLIDWLQSQLQDAPLDDDPSRHIEQLSEWQQQIAAATPELHLLWCFAPHLCVRLGPSYPIAPLTPWLASRLEGITIARLEAEPIAWGELTSDAILSARRDGWRIDLRATIYHNEIEAEQRASSQDGLHAILDDPEDIILWRQELNLAHEWGHLFIESHLPYQEPLLERLSPHHPSQGAAIFSWFEALLEGLAECAPGQGALSFLAQLGAEEPHRIFAAALLWERAREFSQPCDNEALAQLRHHMLRWLHEPLTPSLPAGQLCQSQAFIEAYTEPTSWSRLQDAIDRGGDRLQTILMETIQQIPSPGQAHSFLPAMVPLLRQIAAPD